MTATLPSHAGVPAAPGMLMQAFGICVDRGGKRLLDGINLRLNPGKFVAILAPSGGGKTTLLKRLAGFTVPPPSQGRILFDGQLLSPQSLTVYRRRVGFVSQDDLLYRNLTGRENLLYAGRLRSVGQPRAYDLRKVVARTIERLGLSAGEADRPVSKLSGGQRRRFSVGVELLSQPGLLLLDEPTAGLDPATETRVVHLLRDIARAGTTVACSTHLLDNLNLFDQVIVLANRQVDFVGSPALLLEHYQARTFTELYERIEARGTGEAQSGLGGTIIVPPSEPGSSIPNNETGTLFPGGESESSWPRLREPVSQPLSSGVGYLKQVSTLTSRCLRNLVRDRRWLVLLFASPLFVAGLINLSQVKPASAWLPLTFAVVAAIWFGLTNSVREVVRERRLYVRERLLGVRPSAYLTAKGVVFGLVGLGQVAALWVMIRQANVLSSDHLVLRELSWWSFGEVAAALWGCYLAALGLGLLISTLATSEEWAVAMLPLAILPQLLLTGVATGTAGSDPDLAPREWFYPLAPSWTILRQGPAPRDTADTNEETGTAVPESSGVSEATSAHWDWRWWVEGASLLTYSRPGLDVLHLCWRTRTGPAGERLQDVAHLAVVVGLTAGAAWLAFRWRERRWLREA
jgi:ABC-type multidrug transport system ATPase subunit